MRCPSVTPRKEFILLGVIVIGGMAVRSYGMIDRSIWFDEAASWRTVQFPWREMFARIAADNHVPLHYVLLKVWTLVFGDSLAAMRGLSVLLSGITMVGVYLFATEAVCRAGAAENAEARSFFESGRWIGLVAAALVAVNLLQIKVAWEARMYTLGTALTAISSWTLFRALHAPGPARGPWTMHAIATLLLAYTHHFGMFSIAGQVAFLTGYFVAGSRGKVAAILKNPSFRSAVFCYGFVALGWALWLPVLARQIQQVQNDWCFGPLSMQHALQQLRELIFGNTSSPMTAGSLLVAAAVFAAVILALAWRAGVFQWYILSLVVFPILGGLTVSLVGNNVFISRYQVFAQTILLIGIAVLLARFRNLWLRRAAAAFLIISSAANFEYYWINFDLLRKPGMRGAVAHIESHRHPDEQVVVFGSQLYLPAIYHLSDRSHYHVYKGERPDPHYFGQQLLIADDFISGDQLDKLGPGEVWTVSPWHVESIPVPENWRLDQKLLFRDWGRIGDIKVEMYEISGTPQ